MKELETYTDISGEKIVQESHEVEVGGESMTVYIVRHTANDGVDEISRELFATLPEARIYFTYLVASWLACGSNKDGQELPFDEMLKKMADCEQRAFLKKMADCEQRAFLK